MQTDPPSFSPPKFLCNPHVQTVLGFLKQPTFDAPFEKVQLNIEDRFYLTGRLYRQNSKQLVILFHGLGGSTASGYMQGLAKAFYHANFNVASMALPGNEDSSPYLYHAGEHWVFDAVQSHFEKDFDEIGWVGVSLSANMLLNWLSQPKNICGALAISPVINLLWGALQIDKPKYWIYRQTFLKTLKQLLASKVKLYPDQFSRFSRALKAKYLIEYDELFTCPFHGYATSSEYYKRNSSLYSIKHITNPTNVIVSQDDLFTQSSDFSNMEKNKSIHLYFPRHGGHVGFVPSWGSSSSLYAWAVSTFSKMKSSTIV